MKYCYFEKDYCNFGELKYSPEIFRLPSKEMETHTPAGSRLYWA